jgi:hypothetical protein
MAGVALGALLGGVAAYVAFTEPGQRLWLAFEAQAERAVRQLRDTQGVALRVAQHVDEGLREWRSFRDLRQGGASAA